MTKNPSVLCIIPARSGSKGIPDKNIKLFKGKPLLAYSIEHALGASLITRTVVSTDSATYADIARQYGAETPFLRPAELSGDLSTDLEVFLHALEWLSGNENYVPDICVHLRPTYPIRNVNEINNIIRLLIENPELDSVRTVVPAPDTPFKMWFRDKRGMLSAVVQTHIKEAYNLPRQELPPVYLQNACIDVVRAAVIIEQKSMTGRKVLGYMMQENYDIDTAVQFDKALSGFDANYSETKVLSEKEKKRFCFDIDGVIATIVPVSRYDTAGPLTENILLINALYDKGHYIILFTARGVMTGMDWTLTTKRQMQEWGVKYHELLFQKPAADYYIDDRLISVENLHKMLSVF